MRELASRLLSRLRLAHPQRQDRELGALSAPGAGYSIITMPGGMCWREGDQQREQPATAV
ncbi:MAG: hypothetical protein FJ184_13925 [Gammaproteobacteria bacterium]|nr:hypothetical protein [Gammaproteobacteria bacterium]